MWMNAKDDLVKVVKEARDGRKNPLLMVQLTGPSKAHAFSLLREKEGFEKFFVAYDSMSVDDDIPSEYIQSFLLSNLRSEMSGMDRSER